MGFRDRLVFDPENGAWADGTIRYMMIRPDALMGIFARLDPAARADALAAFSASIAQHGGRSAATYAPGEPQRLLAVIAATAPELGWGIWRFDGDTLPLGLEVRNSPFAHGASFEGPVCHAIAGMLATVAGMVFGVRCCAREVICAADGAPTCRFEAERTG